jgi:hypothetical protein
VPRAVPLTGIRRLVDAMIERLDMADERVREAMPTVACSWNDRWVPLDEAMTERVAILDALIMAVDNRSRLFDIIEAAQTADEARRNVMREFDMNEVQATAVLDLQARRFARMARDRLTREREELRGR